MQEQETKRLRLRSVSMCSRGRTPLAFHDLPPNGPRSFRVILRECAVQAVEGVVHIMYSNSIMRAALVANFSIMLESA